MENWFVLFVRTGAEKRIVEALRNGLDTNIYTPFVSTKAFPLIRKGKITKAVKLCFPGYVFVRSSGGVEAFLKEAAPFAKRVKDAFYFLCYGGDKSDLY
jgi:transcriptional antiterminator NusG